MDPDYAFCGRTELPPPLRPVLITVSRADFPRRRRFAPHVHPHYEMILVERGTYRCLVDGVELTARPGQAVLLAPGDRHEDPLAWPVAFTACTFRIEPSPDPERSPPLFAADAGKAVHVAGPFPALADLAGRARAALDGADAFAWAALDAVAGTALWELVRRLPPAAVAPAFRLHAEAAAFAAAAQRVFQAHLGRPVPVTTLARSAGMHPRAFADGCRRHLGMPPLAAYTAARIGHAAALLAHGGVTVGEVADRLGFANPFHFSRVFRRHRGTPPSRLVR